MAKSGMPFSSSCHVNCCAVAAMALALAVCGCARTPSGATSAAPALTTPNASTAGASHTIRGVLDHFEAGQDQQAANLLIEIASMPDPDERLKALRVWDVSEVEFRRRIKGMNRQRATLWQQEMLDSYTLLRAFSRRVLEIAVDESSSSDTPRAEALFDALEQCADANRGPESDVTLLANTVGDSIKKAVAQTRNGSTID